MAKKNRPLGKHKRHATAKNAVAETRAAEVVTVAWMLMFLFTVLAQATGGAAWLLAWFVEAQEPTALSRLFAPLMLFTAAVAGVCSLALAPLVYRWRRVPPPLAITVLVVASALVALAVLAAQWVA